MAMRGLIPLGWTHRSESQQKLQRIAPLKPLMILCVIGSCKALEF